MNQEIGSEETRTIQELIDEAEEIMVKVNRFWERNTPKDNPTNKDKETIINKLSEKLLKNIKEEHSGYYNAHPFLLVNFCRCIYDREALLSYFNSIINNGGQLGSEDLQIKRISRYSARARASVYIKRGVNISREQIKKESKRIYKEMSEERKLMNDAIEKIKKERERDAEKDQWEKTEADQQIIGETIELFSTEGLENSNELFKESVRQLRESMK